MRVISVPISIVVPAICTASFVNFCTAFNDLPIDLKSALSPSPRQEIEEMLGLSELKQTRVYQEAKEEGKLEAVPKLLQFGLSVEQVAEALGLEVEQVKQAAAAQFGN